MLRIRLPCCALAASGHAAAAPPSSVMNERRLMGTLVRLRAAHYTPLRKNAAVHHSKNCALMSQMGHELKGSARAYRVRFAPVSGPIADIPDRQLRANSRLIQCSEINLSTPPLKGANSGRVLRFRFM